MAAGELQRKRSTHYAEQKFQTRFLCLHRSPFVVVQVFGGAIGLPPTNSLAHTVPSLEACLSRYSGNVSLRCVSIFAPNE